MKLIINKEILKNLIILVGFIFILEAWARIFPYWTLKWTEEKRQSILNMRRDNFSKFLYFHKDLGWVLKNNIRNSRIEYPDINIKFTVDTIPLGKERIGVRDHLDDKEIWAAALGDSFTFGLGVDSNETWIRKLEKMSNKRILNVGQSGFTTIQYLGLYSKLKQYYKPKITFLCIYENDFYDRMKIRSLKNLKSSYIHLNKYNPLGAWLMKNSFAYRLIRAPDTFWRDYKKRKEASFVNVKVEEYQYKDANIDIIFTPRILKRTGEVCTYDITTPKWVDSVEKITEDIWGILSESKSISNNLVVLYFPSREQTYSYILEKKYKISQWFDSPNKAIAKICDKNSIPFLDMTPIFRTRAQNGEQLYWKADGHWNENGNLLAAKTLYKWLKQNHII